MFVYKRGRENREYNVDKVSERISGNVVDETECKIEPQILGSKGEKKNGETRQREYDDNDWETTRLLSTLAFSSFRLSQV